MKIDNNVPAIVRDACIYIIFCNVDLLPTGSEEREVLGFGSIPVAKLPSCQDMNHIALQLHEHEYSWVVKITPQKQYSGHNTPLGYYTDCSPMDLGQHDSLGEYY